MKTDAFDSDEAGTNSEGIKPARVFEALSHERRQHAIQYLTQKPVAVPLGDVAEYIAVREGEPSRDRYERVLTGLYHLHLPYLLDANLVEYDDEHKTVALLVGREALRPYLELLPADAESA